MLRDGVMLSTWSAGALAGGGAVLADADGLSATALGVAVVGLVASLALLDPLRRAESPRKARRKGFALLRSTEISTAGAGVFLVQGVANPAMPIVLAFVACIGLLMTLLEVRDKGRLYVTAATIWAPDGREAHASHGRR